MPQCNAHRCVGACCVCTGTPVKRPLYGSHPIYYQVVPGVNNASSRTPHNYCSPFTPCYTRLSFHACMHACFDGACTGETHGVFLLNSNPMDAVVGPNQVMFKTVGMLLVRLSFTFIITIFPLWHDDDGMINRWHHRSLCVHWSNTRCSNASISTIGRQSCDAA